MKNVFKFVEDKLNMEEEAMLVSIIKSKDSSPRHAGSYMALSSDGKCIGTIGGGTVEYLSQELAKQLLIDKKSFIKEYNLSQNEIEDIGMICGGKILVLFQYIAPTKDNKELFSKINLLLLKKRDSWIITEYCNNTWKCNIYSNGSQLNEKTIDYSENVLQSKCLLIQKEKELIFINPLVKSGRVLIIGGGHVSQKLVPILKTVDFTPVVFDDRSEFLSKELFPDIETKLIDFSDLDSGININDNDYVVIVTRGHKYDYFSLVHALKNNPYYIGLIGSRKKLSNTKYRLINEDGFDENIFNRIHAPIGLDINAETPEEIAISITGELIQIRAGGK